MPELYLGKLWFIASNMITPLAVTCCKDGSSICSHSCCWLQLYVNGEFLGGADIVEEMSEKGELKKALQ